MLFHFKVAKVLFLAKRARPDILKVVSFLCKCIQVTTKQDDDKLKRVLGYLKGMQEHVLVLCKHTCSDIQAYVDAAYALHIDSKSHTGVAIYIGENQHLSLPKIRNA
jgi:hypothetical protein